jgi:hypothetical protein
MTPTGCFEPSGPRALSNFFASDSNDRVLVSSARASAKGPVEDLTFAPTSERLRALSAVLVRQ